ncbi:GTPase IMAP family member 8-like [Sinocyclocheilus grahami]|uniref:GTPase IMAP family member 8-like n=2 Tax=Sinocyclocheilus grahami TaxID=75366 RepID=UPI0007AD4566|nr:PREDICTED: GTPase IMAP family member 8-like [Sinocyclocheilus grahami]
MEPKAYLNLILLGKKRAGKSVSGNTILGREAFISRRRSGSVTPDNTVESGTVDGFPVNVYDTPGICDPELSEDEIQQKIENVLQRCESGHCVFLLVIKADSFTEEERKTVEKIEKLLGEERLNKTWILFTRGDELEEDNLTIQEFLDRNNGLKTLVEKYDQRYHVFNNKKKTAASDQARLLLVNILQRSLGLSVVGHTTKMEPKALNFIILLGKKRAGKSVSGNTILGREAFISRRRSGSVTPDNTVESGTVDGFPVNVYDTPGICDPELSEDEIQQKIENVLQRCESGHCVFLLVIKADSFTEEERKTVEKIEKLLGEERLNKTWILFTRGDELKEDNLTIQEFLDRNNGLKTLVEKYDQRYHVFNNKKKTAASDQARLLLVNILQRSLGLSAIAE